MHDVELLGRIALDLATAGGEHARRRREGSITVESTKSSLADVVTAVDREVEEMIRRLIAERRPDDAILGEEGDDVAGTSGLTWIVDPIDGTVNYLYGQPAWAVSVAVCAGPPNPAEWDLQAAALVAPGLDAVWTATKGGGAFRDGRRLTVSEPSELETALVATGFGYRAEQRATQAQVLQRVLPRVRDIRRLGSAAIDCAMVGEGVVDAYFEQGVNPWDIAAGALVAQEAGAVLRGVGETPPSRDMVILGHPDLADRISDILRG